MQQSSQGQSGGAGLASGQARLKVEEAALSSKQAAGPGLGELGGGKTQGGSYPRVKFLFIPWTMTHQGRGQECLIPGFTRPSLPANSPPPWKLSPPFPTVDFLKRQKAHFSLLLFFLMLMYSTEA